MRKLFFISFIISLALNYSLSQKTSDNSSTMSLSLKPKEKIPSVSITFPSSSELIVSNNSVKITAKIFNITDDKKVQLNVRKNNSIVKPFVEKLSDGLILSWEIMLLEGVNEIEIKAENSAGKDLKKANLIYKKLEPKPEIILLNPIKPQTMVSINQIKISAKFTNLYDEKKVQIRINKDISSIKPQIETKNDGLTYHWDIILSEGDNVIEINAQNSSGNDSKIINIIYQKPIPKPDIVFINPKLSQSIITANQISISAKISNINDERKVQLILNNDISSIQPNTEVTTNGLILNWDLVLQEGENIVEINAQNISGKDVKSINITYKKPEPKPEITLINPIQPQTTTSISKCRIVALIRNIRDEKMVTLKNKANIEFQIFKKEETANGIKITWQLDLLEGINELEINAVSKENRTSSRFTIEYQKPLPPPEITLVNPSENNSQSKIKTIRIVANMLNVLNENDVILKRMETEFKIIKKESFVNGIKLTWQIDLNDGQNDFEVIAYDNMGKDFPKKFRVFYNSPTQAILIPKIWAVIIGISEYQNSAWNLKYAADDAKLFYEFIKEFYGSHIPKENLSLLLNNEATRANVINVLDEKLKMANNNDLVIVYFACHGKSLTGKGVNFLCYDTEPDKIRPTSISDYDIQTSFNNCPANKKIWFADACHSGAINADLAQSRGDLQTNKLILELASKSGCVIFLAAQGEEFSFEDERWGGGHGVFTWYLVKGLRGDALVENNPYISLDNIFDYVKENVRKDTKSKQNPKIKGDYDQDFYIGYRK